MFFRFKCEPVSIRITRPLSAGIEDDLHYLAIKRLNVIGIKSYTLSLRSASRLCSARSIFPTADPSYIVSKNIEEVFHSVKGTG